VEVRVVGAVVATRPIVWLNSVADSSLVSGWAMLAELDDMSVLLGYGTSDSDSFAAPLRSSRQGYAPASARVDELE
jgi:hypothetical protein